MLALLRSETGRAVLLHSGLLPALVSAAILVGVLFAGRVRAAFFGTGLAFAGGFAVAAFREVLPLKPGLAAWHWLPAAALLALVAGGVARPLPWRTGRRLLWGAAAGLTAWLLVPSSLAETWWAIPTLGLVILAEWDLIDRLALTTPGGQVPLFLAAAFLAGSLVILHAHSGRLAEVALIAGGALTGLAVVAWWARIDCAGVVPAAVVLLPGVLLAGQTETYSDVPDSAFALVALAPLVLVVTLAEGLHHWPRLRVALLRGILILVPLVSALVLAAGAESVDLD
jgi:hypothetical protein